MNVGGPAALLTDFINNFSGQEFEHILITGQCEKNEKDYLEIHQINSSLIRLPLMKRSISPISDFKAVFSIARILHEIKPDIVHTHMSKAGFVGRIASLLGYRKSIRVHTFHGHLLVGYFSKLKTLQIISIEKFLAKLTSTLVAVSIDVKNRLLDFKIGNENKWVVINPGVRNSAEKAFANHRNSKHEKFRILWIGRFEPVKDPVLAVLTFEKLNEIYPDVFEFQMAGEGDLLVECKEYSLRKNLAINFLGWVNETKSLYENSDLLLFTSINEGFGMVVVEAALAGVPTVTTDSGGVRDFVSSDIGMIAESTPHELAHSIRSLVEKPTLLNELSQAARVKAIKYFTSEEYNRKHFELYRSLIRTRSDS